MKQRKQFNLADYKPGDKVETRDGRKVRILCTDAKSDCPIIASVTSPTSDEIAVQYNENGEDDSGEKEYDLYIVTEKSDTQQFKPFDKIVARDSSSGEWLADFVSSCDDWEQVHGMGNYYLIEWLPYNEQTAELIGTCDDWKGGEV
jgi:hypothetical protein